MTLFFFLLFGIKLADGEKNALMHKSGVGGIAEGIF